MDDPDEDMDTWLSRHPDADAWPSKQTGPQKTIDLQEFGRLMRKLLRDMSDKMLDNIRRKPRE